MLGRNRLSRRRLGDDSGEDINPMNSLSNLSDCMLVMAVGLMLALISAWQLNMEDIKANIELADQTQDIDITTDEDAPTVEDYGLTEYGKVYQDEDGNYYMIENSDGSEGADDSSGATSSDGE